MKCWHCNKELIWGGDHDIEKENEDYDMVTNLDEDEEKERIKKISKDYIKKKKK